MQPVVRIPPWPLRILPWPLHAGAYASSSRYGGVNSPTSVASGDGVVPDITAPPAKRQHV